MDELGPEHSATTAPVGASTTAAPPPAGTPAPPAPPAGTGSPVTDWPWWTAPLALVAGLLLAAVGGLVVDIPAALLGADVTSSHLPAGLEIVDTVVQDVAFVLAAVLCAQIGGRAVSAWQFGLRPTAVRRAIGLLLLTLLGFLLFSLVWATALHTEKEKLLEQLGTGESTTLLLGSAVLTCVIAPVCEEFLFRGFIFTALRNWHGTGPAAIITGIIFGGVHAGSAPAVDLVPLAALGFGLCLLYRYTGSLYPCIAAHSLNNSLAFGSLEDWTWWQVLLLMACALALIRLLAVAFKRAGVITPEPAPAGAPAFAAVPGAG